MTAQTGSFIIRTDKSADEVQSRIQNACPNLECSVRRLGKDTFKLDVTPKPQASPEARSRTLSAQDIERMLGDQNLKVFDNRLSWPQL